MNDGRAGAVDLRLRQSQYSNEKTSSAPDRRCCPIVGEYACSVTPVRSAHPGAANSPAGPPLPCRIAAARALLDIGCGAGSITAGVAKAVGPDGRGIGIDRDEVLLELARTEHVSIPNLRFEYGDVTTLTYCAQFDIVNAARTLQWIAEPALAISKMKQAAKPSGLVVVLDYNHTRNEWEPDPPGEFKLFYNAFLAWRSTNGWDNEMADHLHDLFRSAGLVEVKSQVQDDVVERGGPDFAEGAALWSDVIESVGGQIVAAGFCTKHELEAARECYDLWARRALSKQTLAMRAVTGIVP